MKYAVPDSLDKAVRGEKLKLLYRNLNVAIPGNLFVLVAIIWTAQHAGQESQWLWWIALLLVLFLRQLDQFAFFRMNWQEKHSDPSYWEKRFLLGVMLTGALWGVIFQGMFQLDNLEAVLLVTCFYTGLIASASGTTAARFSTFMVFMLFIVLAALPMVFAAFRAGNAVYAVLGVAFFVFTLASSIIAYSNSRMIHDSIRLRFEKSNLIARLKQEKSRAEISQQEAEQAMIAKDRFLAAASHDLRQPLHAQGLYLDAIEPYVHGKGTEHLAALRKTNLALSGLFNSLLDVSRLNAGIVEANPEHVRLQGVLQLLYKEFQPHAAHKGLKIKLESENLAVFTDPVLLERILRNLLSNAIRYTRDGEIVLACRQQQNDSVSIMVSDTGIGIPEYEQAYIFDEYYQLDNPERDRSKGLGLGLAIVKKLCELLDIKIHCQSVPGKGSTFTLQVALGDAELVQQERDIFRVVSMEGVKVIVIDDEPDILAGMQHLLGSWGCITLTAASEAEAVEKIGHAGMQPDLLIADYRLRDNQTGAQTILAIRQFCKREIPAMIITGDTSRERLREANASGFYLLHKPVASGQLRATMRRLLKK